jgi:hypothetical protein
MENGQNIDMKEIVIAAYNRDISWTKELTDTKVTIYRKGNTPLDNEIGMDNIGRCVHTFFSHILNNYDNLSDYTFFVQDYPFDHWENLIEIINNNSYKIDYTLNIDGYYGYHYNTIGNHNRISKYNEGGRMWTMYESSIGNGKVLRCLSNGYPQDNNTNINVDKYWKQLFITEPPPIYEFIPGGHFCINKDHVKTRTKDFYKKVVSILEENEHTPWVIERLECYIFNKNYKSIC